MNYGLVLDESAIILGVHYMSVIVIHATATMVEMRKLLGHTCFKRSILRKLLPEYGHSADAIFQVSIPTTINRGRWFVSAYA